MMKESDRLRAKLFHRIPVKTLRIQKGRFVCCLKPVFDFISPAEAEKPF
jgi:hypothetical protein